jgi:hypothetical protein
VSLQLLVDVGDQHIILDAKQLRHPLSNPHLHHLQWPTDQEMSSANLRVVPSWYGLTLLLKILYDGTDLPVDARQVDFVIILLGELERLQQLLLFVEKLWILGG